MVKGWKATGLLAPLWRRYEGGRDALAVNVGTTPNVLSSINTGKRRLGYGLAGRLAAELEVSVLELGAPDKEADAAGQSILDRLAAAEAAAERERKRFDRFVRATTARLAALEAAQAPQARRSGRRS